jgi:hypothetical protein
MPTRGRSRRRPVALFMEVHDLVLAKCAAGRERDWEYAATALAARLVELDTLLERIPTLPVTDAQKQLITARLGALRR